MINTDKQKMIELNKRQKEYYESSTDPSLKTKGNLFTKIWRNLRRGQQGLRDELGVKEYINNQHKEWLGDLSDKKVLDFGCYSGNDLSLYIAENSKSYLGLDLSETAIAELNQSLRDRNISNANAIACDILSENFQERKFDIIYAKSVFHHFEHMEVFLKRIHELLRPGGKVITFDPLQTSLPVLVARSAYRPFQSDRHWEWPFTKKTFELMEKYFNIKHVQGTMGYAKWAIAIAFVSPKTAIKYGKKWNLKDRVEATKLGEGLYRCMQVSMCLEK
jgi:2-polyprenyl-3-methyl-5-hydroxy-6-metoxy-1,4-benzoquinol methylase